jgi:hypothetical protein
LHLLLCGAASAWDDARVDALCARYAGLLSVCKLTREEEQAGVLVNASGEMLDRLGVRDAAQYLVRPDGYIGFRCAGWELNGVSEYLACWYTPVSAGARRPT